MKEFDRVILISNKKKFADLGLNVGDHGIILGEKRNGYFYVVFDGNIFQNEDGIFTTDEISAAALEEDLALE